MSTPLPTPPVAPQSPFDQKNLAEAENTRVSTQTLVVKSWPSAELADRLIYIGLGALSTGGAAFVLAGYPGLTTRLVPAVISWLLGFVLLIFGISALARHDRVRMRHFMNTFKVEDEEVAKPERVGIVRRLTDLVLRREK